MKSDKPFYHSGSRTLQDRFDSRRIADRLFETRRRETLDNGQRAMIEAASFFFLATVDNRGCPDCSIKGGNPGFVLVIGPSVLMFPDYDGNGMYRSLGNLATNPHVGLLFVEFSGERRKLRVNGIAELSDDPELLRGLPGAKLVVRITISDIFPNCPRYLPRLELAEPSPYNPRPHYQAPEPLWKSKPDLRDFLPKTHEPRAREDS
jgi:predicted pyridoxine 5'-phosphate oxidase superfamily flavin-nucleotide-binding protein